MRLNRYLALATGLSRRAADDIIRAGRVSISGQVAELGQETTGDSEVCYDGIKVSALLYQTILLNKPAGYITSRNGQGSQTIYDLLPAELHQLKPVGRLDRDSQGLLALTNDGQLANRLTHPKYNHPKRYHVGLDRSLTRLDEARLRDGIGLHDGVSRPEVLSVKGVDVNLVLYEGRNRQLRRTFEQLGYSVKLLERVSLAGIELGNLPRGHWRYLTDTECEALL